MELHADERAGPRLRDDPLRPAQSHAASRRRTSARSRTLAERHDIGPAEARNAALAQAHRAPRERGRGPSRRRPPRSTRARAAARGRCRARPPGGEPFPERRRPGRARAARPSRPAPSRRPAARRGRPADVVDELGAEPPQRELDRAHVAGAVPADRDLHTRPLVDGSPAVSRERRRAAHVRPP